MSDTKIVDQRPTKAGKASPAVLLTPRTAQWMFLTVLVGLFGLSRMGGAFRAFFRSFSTFLLP